MDINLLIDKARGARENAYAPYSHFRVGAALLTASGNIYTGCNVENAAYGATNCAERTAIFKAVSEGERDFSALAIIGDSDGYVFPCGICRQVIWEFSRDMDIIVCAADGRWQRFNIKELLPNGFEL